MKVINSFCCCLLMVIVHLADAKLRQLRLKRAYPVEASIHWDYSIKDGPPTWQVSYPLCGLGEQQSPININTTQTKFNNELEAIELIGDGYLSQQCVTNNGHTALVNVSNLYMTGADLPSVFSISAVHFHWATASSRGSEHTFDNTRYPLEMHAVFYDSQRYATLNDALNGQDSVAVLSFLFQISPVDNPLLRPLTSVLAQVATGGTALLSPTGLDFKAILDAADGDDYYRYEGSLTTPPCSEVVIWTVLATTVNISESQMAQFRRLTKNEDGVQQPVADNWRPPQPLNGRIVSRSFLMEGEDFDDDVITHSAAKKLSYQLTNTFILVSLLFSWAISRLL